MNEGGAKALGKAIGDARRNAGMTQQDLCAAANLSYSTLAKIERGAIKTPSVFTVQAIAEATGTTVAALIGGVEGVQPHVPAKDYKTSKSGIQFIYFDINGVMVRFFHRAFSQLAIDTGANADQIESTFWHYNDAVCRGEMSVDEFNNVLGRSIGVEYVDWQSYYMNAVEAIAEVRECFEWAYQHFKVGLLSNIFPGFIADMQRRNLLPSQPDIVIIDSSQVNAIKPESHLYQLAAQRAGTLPGNILLIDDSRTNLMAAEREGWHVMWFDDFRPEESVKRVRSALEF